MTRQPPLEAGGCLRSQAGSIGLCLRTHPAQVSAASSMEWMWRPVWRASPGRQQALVLCGLEEALPMAGGSHKAFWAMWSGCSFGPSHLQFQSSHLRLSNSPPDPLYVHRLAQVGRRGTREVGRRECVRDSVPPQACVLPSGPGGISQGQGLSVSVHSRVPQPAQLKLPAVPLSPCLHFLSPAPFSPSPL